MEDKSKDNSLLRGRSLESEKESRVKLSTTLATNITTPEIEPTLFSTLPEEEQKEWTNIGGWKQKKSTDGVALVQRTLELSPKEANFVLYLNEYLQERGGEALQERINLLETDLKRGKGEYEGIVTIATNSKLANTSFKLPVNLIELTKRIEGNNQFNLDKLIKVGQLLEGLKERKYTELYLIDNSGYTIRRKRTLLHIDDTIDIIETPEELKRMFPRGKMRYEEKEINGETVKTPIPIPLTEVIIFSDIFLYKLNSRFCYTPENRALYWRNTDLFQWLYFTLLPEYSERLNKALKIGKTIRKKYTDKYGDNPKADILEKEKKELQKARRAALTFTISGEDIRNSVKTNYYIDTSTRKQLIKHLEEAIKSFLSYGLIEEAKIHRNRDGRGTIVECVDFIFNIDYYKQSSNPGKGLEKIEEE